MAAPRLNKNNLDVARIFLTFVTYVGDIEKTASELDLDPAVVRALAEKEEWQSQIARVCLMSKTGKPGDWERAANRALCFVQAHQIRGLIDRMLQSFKGLTAEQVVERLATYDRQGNVHVSARFFADLTAAAEKAHQMAYSALGDTLGERPDRSSEETDKLNANALHAAVISALNNPSVKPAQVVEEVKRLQDETTKQIVEAEVVPTKECEDCGQPVDFCTCPASAHGPRNPQ